jgi:histidinol-phosphate aminotransferase
VVIIDEAYVDFGAESCVELIAKYDNLLVTRTFSKSRSLAGARLGFGIGSEELIRDLNTIRYSVHPYNVNSMTQAAGAAAIADEAYYAENCRRIEEIRAYAAGELIALGFEVLPSKANFLFARSPDVPGGELYRKLKERGVLVRWFDSDRIRDFTRITVGTREQMDILLDGVRNILEERGANQ